MPKYVTQEEVFQILTELNDPFGAKVRTTEAMRRISAIPAADVAPVRHGQKIDITSAEDFLPWCKCSVCSYDGLFLEDEYCSRCGAKLDVSVINVGEME